MQPLGRSTATQRSQNAGRRPVEAAAAIGVDEDGVETCRRRGDELDGIGELDGVVDMEMASGERNDRRIVLDDGKGAVWEIGRKEPHHRAAAEAEKKRCVAAAARRRRRAP